MKELESWSRAILQPDLPPIKQGTGADVGFFDQAFILVGITVFSVIAGGAFTMYRFVKH